jgi:hypothetical protein
VRDDVVQLASDPRALLGERRVAVAALALEPRGLALERDRVAARAHEQPDRKGQQQLEIKERRVPDIELPDRRAMRVARHHRQRKDAKPGERPRALGVSGDRNRAARRR